MQPRSIRTGQPPDPVPCLLPGWLGTDLNGIGKGLPKHALQRRVTAADFIGGGTLIVNVVDVEAGTFIEHRPNLDRGAQWNSTIHPLNESIVLPFFITEQSTLH